MCCADRDRSRAYRLMKSRRPPDGWPECLPILAPRSGLEPGTIGLTIQRHVRYACAMVEEFKASFSFVFYLDLPTERIPDPNRSVLPIFARDDRATQSFPDIAIKRRPNLIAASAAGGAMIVSVLPVKQFVTFPGHHRRQPHVTLSSVEQTFRDQRWRPSP